MSLNLLEECLQFLLLSWMNPPFFFNNKSTEWPLVLTVPQSHLWRQWFKYSFFLIHIDNKDENIYFPRSNEKNKLKERQITTTWISSSPRLPALISCHYWISYQVILKIIINPSREFKSTETEWHRFKLSILRSLREQKIASCFAFRIICWCMRTSSTVTLFFNKWQIIQ